MQQVWQMAKKMTKQSTQTMLKCSGSELLMCYTTQFRNNTIVYASHFEFNGNHIKHDRNGSAYDVIFTANATYILVLVQRPTSIQLFDLRNGDIMIARGMDDILSSRVVAVATQNQQGLKPNQQTRRINLILQQKGSYLLKVIQIESKVDNNPKTRHKMLEQGNISYNSNIRSEPIFSLCRWNLFILIRKGIMRVCRAANKNDEISIQFAAQGFQKSITSIFNNSEILGMSQSLKTWAILRGNDLNSRNDSKIELMVFWQHYFSPEINRNMYYRDQSYIKSVTLPCTQQEYKRMWQNNGFYLIQTQSRQLNSHYCHIISEQNGIQMITIKIGDNSNVCPHTLMLDSNQISICQIQNGKQLNRLKISEEQSNLSQQTRASSIIGNTTVQERAQGKRNCDGNGIRKFEPVKEEIKNQETIIDDVNSGKSTTKKIEKVPTENKKVEQIKGLLNSQIVDHFTRIDKQKQKQQAHTEEEENLEVPNSIQPVISFGQAGPIKAKTPVTSSNTLLVSFGTQQTKSETPDPASQNKAEQKKQEKLIKASEVKQLRQHFNHHQCNLIKQLAERQQSYNQNYKSLPSKELFTVQKILTKQQLGRLMSTQKIMFGIQADLKRSRLKQMELENSRDKKLKKWQQTVQRVEKMISLLKVHQSSQIDLGFKGKGRKNKQINQQMISQLKKMSERLSLLQKQSNQLLIENQKQLDKYTLQQKPLKSTKQVLSFLNGRPKEMKMQKCLRIPIQRLIFCEPSLPLIIIDPLEI